VSISYVLLKWCFTLQWSLYSIQAYNWRSSVSTSATTCCYLVMWSLIGTFLLTFGVEVNWCYYNWYLVLIWLVVFSVFGNWYGSKLCFLNSGIFKWHLVLIQGGAITDPVILSRLGLRLLKLSFSHGSKCDCALDCRGLPFWTMILTLDFDSG